MVTRVVHPDVDGTLLIVCSFHLLISLCRLSAHCTRYVLTAQRLPVWLELRVVTLDPLDPSKVTIFNLA